MKQNKLIFESEDLIVDWISFKFRFFDNITKSQIVNYLFKAGFNLYQESGKLDKLIKESILVSPKNKLEAFFVIKGSYCQEIIIQFYGFNAKNFDNLIKQKLVPNKLFFSASLDRFEIHYSRKNRIFNKISYRDKNQKVKVGELFAGVGGISSGFERAGFEVAWANEIDKNACKTYKLNYKHKLYEEDIHNLNPKDLESVDILSGGFPCQAFSIAGYRKGFKDKRGNLFFEIMRLADEIKPKVIFLENVKNLENHDKGNTFKIILKALEQKGYFVKYKVLNTCKYSEIPQNRERIYIVAFKEKKNYDNFSFPLPIKKTKKIKELLQENVDDYYYYTNTKYYQTLKKEMSNKDSVYQWRRIYARENKSGVCPTLTANMGTGGHNVPLVIDNKDIRKLTPRECFRFQGFSDEFKLPKKMSRGALYKQAGNSVSTVVIERIANNIMKALKIDKSTS